MRQASSPGNIFSIDAQIAEGDEVVNRITFRGTHLGKWRGMAPTGEEVVFRFSPEGKVVEIWDYFDQLNLWR
jgi:predicted ester cyclase